MHDNIRRDEPQSFQRISRVGRPNTVGVVLVLLGVYFLLNQFGWAGWLSSMFWPAADYWGGGVFVIPP